MGLPNNGAARRQGTRTSGKANHENKWNLEATCKGLEHTFSNKQHETREEQNCDNNTENGKTLEQLGSRFVNN